MGENIPAQGDFLSWEMGPARACSLALVWEFDKRSSWSRQVSEVTFIFS